ncbi:hypothetical protein [Geosporobacter ferrireducens]|uniref:DUF4190 domain-containing protein n=1 Tax=Geosporobacter ferrireducens TaxID=1424294 RepID=A0A1D8GIP2_9FIRM|nr:hypothetical protein [Geosporobacter ferrireducens]AOT70793.1 hypothetical protein Gferi_15235 [Geosporobacter ferrireducens]MTI53487.1 hypothetical protein [Geosporobacter ferrireducens]
MDEFLTDGRYRTRRSRKKEKNHLAWVSVIIGLIGIPMLSPLYTFFYLTPLYLIGAGISISGWQKKKNPVDLLGILLNSISFIWTLIAWWLVISLWLGI